MKSYLLMAKSRISAVCPWYSDTMLPERASHRRRAPSKLQVDTTEEDSSHCRCTMPAWRSTETRFRRRWTMKVFIWLHNNHIWYHVPENVWFNTQRGGCNLSFFLFLVTSCWHLCLRICVDRSYMARVPSRYATARRGRLGSKDKLLQMFNSDNSKQCDLDVLRLDPTIFTTHMLQNPTDSTELASSSSFDPFPLPPSTEKAPTTFRHTPRPKA